MELDRLNLRNPIKLGYYDPFDILPHVKDDLESKFPLTNLHWKHGDSKLHSIALLPVTLVEEVPKLGSTNDESIYSRIMFVQYDNLDIYRSQVRPLIKEWLKNLVIPYDSEWMLVLYIPLTVKDKPSTIVKHSSYDKLKLDFGEDGQELLKLNSTTDRLRCFKIKQQDTSIVKLEAINEIIQSLKSNLLTSFTRRYDFLIKKLTPDDLSQNFITRLELGDLFNDMRLFQESLDIYDDLQLDLNQLMKQNQFSLKIDLPQNYIGYQFEQSVQMVNLKKLDNDVALFDIKCVLFINQSVLLQSLANFSKTLSISAIYISNLYQRLIKFLQDLLNNFPNYDLNEFIVVLCDYYLDLPICSKLIEINNNNNDDLGYQVHEILEFRGELRLFERSRLLQIGSKFDYQIEGIQMDIGLDEQEFQDYTYDKIKNIIESPDSFYQQFESITESIIEDFVKSGRSKSIDLLSIDLALLHYQQKKYQEALMILQDSFDFFINNGWNFMGGFLLEVYLNCLTQLDVQDYKLMTTTCLKLFANVGDTKSQDVVGINNFGGIKQKSQLENLFQRIVEYSGKMNSVLEFPLDLFFNLTQIPYLVADEDSYKYYVEIILDIKSEITFDVQSITLSMADFETNETMIFKTSNFALTDKKIKLYSNEFKLGVFSPLKLIISVNENLKFVQEINSADDETEEHNTTTTEILAPKINNIYLYQNPKKFWCQFSNSTDMALGSSELLLSLNNADFLIENLQVEISSETGGIEFTGDVKLKINKIDCNDKIDLKIPYLHFNDEKLVNIKAQVEYFLNGEKHTHVIQDEIDTTLTVSVSVQDTFRKDFIYSKFQIGTAISRKPLRLLSTELVTNNDKYEISRPGLPLDPLITFAEQPASIFYKIIPKENHNIKNDDCLDLDVYYLNIREECEAYILEHYSKSMGPIFEEYKLIVSKLIVQEAKYDLNSFAINSYIRILNSSEIKQINDNILPKYIKNKDNLVKLQNQIRQLIDKVVTMGDSIEYPKNKLHISVPIPTLQFLLIVDFDFKRHSQYLVGEPISTKVVLTTITRWACEGTKSKSQHFQFCLQNDDNWLISGSKKQSYIVETSQENVFEFDLVLIPLIVGNLTLPRVSIKQLGEELKDSDMDLSLQNGLETILVVPELDSITFSF